MKKWNKGDLAKSAAKVFLTVGPLAAVMGMHPEHAFDTAVTLGTVLGTTLVGGSVFAGSLICIFASPRQKLFKPPKHIEEILANDETRPLLRDFLSSSARGSGPAFVDIPYQGRIVRIVSSRSIAMNGPAAGHK